MIKLSMHGIELLKMTLIIMQLLYAHVHLCIKVFTAKVPKANDNLISMQLCNCESST